VDPGSTGGRTDEGDDATGRSAGTVLTTVVAFVGGLIAVALLVIAVEAAVSGSDDEAAQPASGAQGTTQPPTTTAAPTTEPPVSEELGVEREGQLAAARASIPGGTVADALAAGFALYAPDEAANDVHLAAADRIDGTFEAGRPEMVLAASQDPAAPLLALVYWVEGDAPPEGFAGAADEWHRHGVVCEAAGRTGFGAATVQECIDGGGTVRSPGGWMLHLWVVPGQDNPAGRFAITNPALGQSPQDHAHG
jgi:hypothetical protein